MARLGLYQIANILSDSWKYLYSIDEDKSISSENNTNTSNIMGHNNNSQDPQNLSSEKFIDKFFVEEDTDRSILVSTEVEVSIDEDDFYLAYTLPLASKIAGVGSLSGLAGSNSHSQHPAHLNNTGAGNPNSPVINKQNVLLSSTQKEDKHDKNNKKSGSIHNSAHPNNQKYKDKLNVTRVIDFVEVLHAYIEYPKTRGSRQGSSSAQHRNSGSVGGSSGNANVANSKQLYVNAQGDVKDHNRENNAHGAHTRQLHLGSVHNRLASQAGFYNLTIEYGAEITQIKKVKFRSTSLLQCERWRDKIRKIIMNLRTNNLYPLAALKKQWTRLLRDTNYWSLSS